MIFNVMRLKSALQPVLSAFSGAALGFLVWWAYWNLNVIPGTAWPAIVSSPLMHAIRELSPDLDIPIAITIKALPLSLLLGFIGGYLQPRFKFSQTYCYSVLLWPLAYFIFGYYTIWSLDSVQWPYTQALWRSWHDHRVIAFAVYAWFFVGFYVGAAIAKRCISAQSAGLAASSASRNSQPVR